MSNYDDPLDNLTPFVGEHKVITVHVGGKVIWSIEGIPHDVTVMVKDYDEDPTKVTEWEEVDWEEIRWEGVR